MKPASTSFTFCGRFGARFECGLNEAVWMTAQQHRGTADEWCNGDMQQASIRKRCISCELVRHGRLTTMQQPNDDVRSASWCAAAAAQMLQQETIHTSNRWMLAGVRSAYEGSDSSNRRYITGISCFCVLYILSSFPF
jgi:hypothetical protein